MPLSHLQWLLELATHWHSRILSSHGNRKSQNFRSEEYDRYHLFYSHFLRHILLALSLRQWRIWIHSPLFTVGLPGIIYLYIIFFGVQWNSVNIFEFRNEEKFKIYKDNGKTDVWMWYSAERLLKIYPKLLFTNVIENLWDELDKIVSKSQYIQNIAKYHNCSLMINNNITNRRKSKILWGRNIVNREKFIKTFHTSIVISIIS